MPSRFGWKRSFKLETPDPNLHVRPRLGKPTWKEMLVEDNSRPSQGNGAVYDFNRVYEAA